VVPAQSTEKPPGAEGPLMGRFTFQTGDDLTPPLTLAGPLRVRLETYDSDVITCETHTSCGPVGCKKTGTERALRARVTVPAARGGLDFDGYRGIMYFTDNAPVTFSGEGEGRGAPGGLIYGGHYLELRPGVETEVLTNVIDEHGPYTPCFSLNVWDPGGHAVQADPICLPPIVPSEHVRQLDAATIPPVTPPAPGAPTAPAARGDEGSDSALGCSAATGTPRSPGILALALATLTVRWRRRRASR
jgi:hypothetical protein